MPEYRAHFDFDISFANGGGLAGTGFRLDLPSADVGEDEIARLLVAHLGLALVDEVALRGLRIVEEPHRGSRGVEVPAGVSGTRVVDLSHPIRAGLVTYPGTGSVDGVLGDHTKLTPPLILTRAQADEIVAIMDAAIGAVEARL